MTTRLPEPTLHFIVADGLTPESPLEIWVDWVDGVDWADGTRHGNARWSGDDLIVAGGMTSRKVQGLDHELAEDIRARGGCLVAATSRGEASRIIFGPSAR